jgi:hypothetical protein
MYEHLVKNVRGHIDKTGGIQVVYIAWDNVNGESECSMAMTLSRVAAVETWLKQPQPLTAEQRAERIVREANRSHDGYLYSHDWRALEDAIAVEIRAAEDTAKGQGTG